MKGGTYTKTLAKIQVKGTFRIRDIRRNVLARFTQIYRDLYGDVMLLLTWMSSDMADGNQQKHPLLRFVTKA